MTTKRETILLALHTLAQGVPGYEVQRNAPLGDVAGTYVCLHDGENEPTDEFFNAEIFEFTMRPVLLIVVQDEDPAARDAALDAAVEAFATALEAAVPLDANATDVRVLPPELAPRELWGALAMKGAELPIEIDYWADRASG